MINKCLVNISLIIFGILTLFFIFFPNMDIVISKMFYTEELHFLYRNNPIVKFPFHMLTFLSYLFILVGSLYILYILIKYRDIKKVLRCWAFFLCISAAIGPGLIVNSVLKENFGRARPKSIIEFSGDKTFSRAFSLSDQCTNNCSFSSGHAAMAFYFTAIAYIVGASYFTRIYTGFLIFGFFVGISRIIMGGHFASDVTTSAFIVLFINHMIYLLWNKKNLKHKKSR